MTSTTSANNNNNNNTTNDNSNNMTKEYNSLLSSLLSYPHVFYSAPKSPHPLLIPQSSSSPIPTISSLSLHPAIESTLHIINADLPSAHFLLRHAQSDPATEMMFLHGILHRIEGDVDNTRAWYAKITEMECFVHVWGEDDGKWKGFLDRIQRWRDSVASRSGSKGKMSGAEGIDWEKEEEELRETSLWEIKRVLEYCEGKFGKGQVVDATKVWVKQDDGNNGMQNAMITGGEGWREF